MFPGERGDQIASIRDERSEVLGLRHPWSYYDTYILTVRGVPVVLRDKFGADMEADDGWRNGSGIHGGGRGKGESDGLGRWAVEEALVGGLGKRHWGCIRC